MNWLRVREWKKVEKEKEKQGIFPIDCKHPEAAFPLSESGFSWNSVYANVCSCISGHIESSRGTMEEEMVNSLLVCW